MEQLQKEWTKIDLSKISPFSTIPESCTFTYGQYVTRTVHGPGWFWFTISFLVNIVNLERITFELRELIMVEKGHQACRTHAHRTLVHSQCLLHPNYTQFIRECRRRSLILWLGGLDGMGLLRITMNPKVTPASKTDWYSASARALRH